MINVIKILYFHVKIFNFSMNDEAASHVVVGPGSSFQPQARSEPPLKEVTAICRLRTVLWVLQTREWNLTSCEVGERPKWPSSDTHGTECLNSGTHWIKHQTFKSPY